MNFKQRKQERTDNYFKFEFGWVLKDCTACNGSGYYDSCGSPPCGACEGTGKEKVKGEKSKIN
jgi:DnaJ-class molecular chaperone